MNWKKTFVAMPLSFSLLMSGAALTVSAHNGEKHETPAVSTPASDLRAALDALLSEHAYLAVITMQKGIDGAADFEESAAALQANTDDLSAAVASVYGEEAGQQFKEIWSSHIGYFVDYVTASAAGDEAAKEAALANLAEYKAEQAAFLETATEGRLKASELEEGLQMHIDQLIWAFENYTMEDFDKTYENLRHSLHHMFGFGKGLAWAITDQFPEKFGNTSVDTLAADLRADLNYLLSEHAALAISAMQKGIDGAPDFEAAAAALTANTDDLSAAIGSVYGEEAAQQFKDIWSSHIGYFVDYVTATAAGDEAAKEAAIAALEEYKAEQAAFLEAATDGRLKAEDVEAALDMHVEELLTAFNSYTEKDYAAAYSAIREAYAHMFGVGTVLSSAIVDQFPEKFEAEMPTEMPKTGMGGMADEGDYAAEIAVSLMALGAVSLLAVRRREAKNEG
ncbi:copper amine oxidase [Indiicoccus explosivorum]|uniref:copper amine oxidase n=1 Tax=Indiicoccus explosivorum TaxID=1917864 RepID=UPI000B44615C|nr:copper amine oxidase [Indiicoccus explosivorum]